MRKIDASNRQGMSGRFLKKNLDGAALAGKGPLYDFQPCSRSLLGGRG